MIDVIKDGLGKRFASSVDFINDYLRQASFSIQVMDQILLIKHDIGKKSIKLSDCHRQIHQNE